MSDKGNGTRFAATNRGTLNVWMNERDGDCYFTINNSKKNKESGTYEPRKTLSLADLAGLADALHAAEKAALAAGFKPKVWDDKGAAPAGNAATSKTGFDDDTLNF